MYGEKTFDGKQSAKALCKPPEVSTILSTNSRYAAFDAARAFLCAMAAIGQKPDIRLREEMGVDIG